MKHLISLKDIDKEDVYSLFNVVDNKDFCSLKTKLMGCAFFQPSTRTRLSFEAAMLQLGGQVVGFADRHVTRCFDNYFDESLEDFTRVMSEMVDILVVRHFEDNVPRKMARFTNTPIINAGDGTNEHPTQALQDIWLMRQKAGSLVGKTVGFLGDISRAHRSIVFGLRYFNVSKLLFMLPPNVALPEDIGEFLHQHNINYELYTSLADLLVDADFINSFTPSMSDLEDKKNTGSTSIKVFPNYTIGRDLYNKTNSQAYILNAGPRTYEVAADMDTHPNFLFFEQVRTGLMVRQAIVSYIFQCRNKIDKQQVGLGARCRA